MVFVTPCLFSVTLSILSLVPSGLCLEKVPAASPSLTNKNTGSPSSNRSTTEREQEIITCYEKSGDIALLYLQEAEKVHVGGILVFYVMFSTGPLVWGCLIGVLVWQLSIAVFSHTVSHKHSPSILLAPGLPSPLPSLWVCGEYSADSVQVWLIRYRPWQPTGKQISSSLFGECLRGCTGWAGKQR